MLKLKHPNIKGLKDCTLSDTLNFESIEGEILNCDRTHWVCVSSFGCKQGNVNMFDSKQNCEILLSTKEAIACILGTTCKCISLRFVDVQQQSNNYDCGLFALAYASSICDGISILQLLTIILVLVSNRESRLKVYGYVNIATAN